MLLAAGTPSATSAPNSEASVDYPDFIRRWRRRSPAVNSERGIVLGGSGNGEAIVANRVRGVRCGLCWNEQVQSGIAPTTTPLPLARQRTITEAEALKIVNVWLETAFEGGRHLARLKKIDP